MRVLSDTAPGAFECARRIFNWPAGEPARPVGCEVFQRLLRGDAGTTFKRLPCDHGQFATLSPPHMAGPNSKRTLAVGHPDTHGNKGPGFFLQGVPVRFSHREL
jgi:hypothetical protein